MGKRTKAKTYKGPRTRSQTGIIKATATTTKKNKKLQEAAGRAVPWHHTWSKGKPYYTKYMDEEWGVEAKDNNHLFECLSLSGQQSGVKWDAILRKRSGYRSLFHDFKIEEVSKMTQDDVENILQSNKEEVIGNKKKLRSIVNNAKVIQQMDTSFHDYIYKFINNRPILNYWKTFGEIPVDGTLESRAISKIMKEDGFQYVGPIVIYAFMQSVGMVMDHPLNSPQRSGLVKELEGRDGGYQDRKGIKGICADEGYLGMRLLRYFKEEDGSGNVKGFVGEVTKFFMEEDKGKKMLWHVCYDDGDEEDLYEDEFVEAVIRYQIRKV